MDFIFEDWLLWGGISLFGFSGMNVYVVLEEYIFESEYVLEDGNDLYLFVLFVYIEVLLYELIY